MHTGAKAHIFWNAYAALKRRSSTVVQTKIRFLHFVVAVLQLRSE